MLLKELFENQKISTEDVPMSVLNLQIGDNKISEIKSGERKKNKIEFNGNTGNADVKIIIDLTGVNKDEVELINDYMFNGNSTEDNQEIHFENLKEYLFNPVVTSITSFDKRAFIIEYNVFGGEISRS